MSSQTTVAADELAKEIVKALNEYTENVSEAIYEAIGDIAKESQRKLRAVRSVPGSKTWNKYPRTWTTQSKKKRDYRKDTVWNSRHAAQTTWLEHGHVIKNGTGRTYGRTQAFPHIKPIEEAALEKLDQAIKEAIEKG